MLKHRYVEVSYRMPGDDDWRFRAFVLEAETPNKAAAEAKRETRIRHPQATEVDEFMQRTITPERAEEILREFRAGTWAGWVFA